MRAILWWPDPRKHPDYIAQEKRFLTTPFSDEAQDFSELLNLQTKNMEAALLSTNRLEDRVHALLWVVLSLIGITSGSLTWIAQLEHSVASELRPTVIFCIVAYGLAAAVLLKMRIAYDKPCYPPWYAELESLRGCEHPTQGRARICQLVFCQHRIIQVAMTRQMHIPLILTVLAVLVFTLRVVLVLSLS